MKITNEWWKGDDPFPEGENDFEAEDTLPAILAVSGSEKARRAFELILEKVVPSESERRKTLDLSIFSLRYVGSKVRGNIANVLSQVRSEMRKPGGLENFVLEEECFSGLAAEDKSAVPAKADSIGQKELDYKIEKVKESDIMENTVAKIVDDKHTLDEVADYVRDNGGMSISKMMISVYWDKPLREFKKEASDTFGLTISFLSDKGLISFEDFTLLKSSAEK